MNRRDLLKRFGQIGLGVASLPIARLAAQENIESKLAEIEQFVRANPTNQYSSSGRGFEYRGVNFTVRVDNTGISLQSRMADSNMVYHASQRNYGSPDAMGYSRGNITENEAMLMVYNFGMTDEVLGNNARLMGEVNVLRGRTNQTITPYQKQITFKVGKDGNVRAYDFFRGITGAPEEVTLSSTYKMTADNYNPLVNQIYSNLIKKPEVTPKR